MGERQPRGRALALIDVLAADGPVAWTLDLDVEGGASPPSLRDEWLGQLVAEDRPGARASLAAWVEGRSDDLVFEGRVARAGGEPPRWVEVAGSVVLRTPEGRPLRLAGAARALAPSLAIVVASGRFEEYGEGDLAWPERCVRLDKPFGPERLIAAVAAALATRAPAQSSASANPVSS